VDPLDLSGKNAIVLGVANHRSIAWGIARELSARGARLALTYQGERFKGTLEKLAHRRDRKTLERIVQVLTEGDFYQKVLCPDVPTFGHIHELPYERNRHGRALLGRGHGSWAHS